MLLRIHQSHQKYMHFDTKPSVTDGQMDGRTNSIPTSILSSLWLGLNYPFYPYSVVVMIRGINSTGEQGISEHTTLATTQQQLKHLNIRRPYTSRNAGNRAAAAT